MGIISYRLFAALVFTNIICCAAPAPLFSSGRVSETIIKVNILSGKSELKVESEQDFTAADIFTLDTLKLEKETGYTIMPEAGGLSISGKVFGSQVRIIPGESGSFIKLNGRRYRDTIIIVKNSDGLSAINELGVDGYLFGVLPVEVSPKWPIESLKAQAVVSRTYVLNNLGKYSKKGYDLSSDIFSQMYKGVDVEDSESNRAVIETKGIVLAYKNELALAYFHSSCGGYTADVKEVWGNAIPYMRGVTCPYCKDSPRYHWEKHISGEFIGESLRGKGYDTGEVSGIKFLSRTDSGRIKDMYVIHSGGKLLITGHRFRMAIGPDIIKSALMALDRSKPGFYFYGRGWGHGVGMCQWGAKGLAEKGKNYKYILKFYFPGAHVTKWRY
ncbi:MAG: SpoIID/LytB domain-containing protein [Elusimicrobiota bacterium]